MVIFPDNNQPNASRLSVRQLSATAGTFWIRIAYELYKENPALWIRFNAVYFLVLTFISMIPALGPLLVPLLNPVLMAGIMAGCHQYNQYRRPPLLAYLFLPFKSSGASGLVATGGIYLVILIITMVLMSGGDLSNTMLVQPQDGSTPNPAEMPQVNTNILLFLPFIFIFTFMMNFFAPALVAFTNMRAIDALRISLLACWKNIIPFSIYALSMLGVVIGVSVPFFLIMSLVNIPQLAFVFATMITMLVMPLYHLSMYCAYRTIFSDPKEPSQNPTEEYEDIDDYDDDDDDDDRTKVDLTKHHQDQESKETTKVDLTKHKD